VIDRSGLVIPQARVGFASAKVTGTGTITYRCHTCGEALTRPWEVFYVDDTPGLEWASEFVPPRTTPRTTTHHAWHMASQQYED
jgi:hypothetical protein